MNIIELANPPENDDKIEHCEILFWGFRHFLILKYTFQVRYEIIETLRNKSIVDANNIVNILRYLFPMRQESWFSFKMLKQYIAEKQIRSIQLEEESFFIQISIGQSGAQLFLCR